MTIRELITHLRDLPEEAKVFFAAPPDEFLWPAYGDIDLKRWQGGVVCESCDQWHDPGRDNHEHVVAILR